MKRTWRSDAEGLVLVTDDGQEFTPTLRDPAQIALVEHGIARWGSLFRNVGETYGVDWRWLIAHAYRESGFNPRATLIERGKDGKPIISPGGRPLVGVGLFQITHPSLKGTMTDEQLYEPTTNTAIAARHISMLMRRAECRVDGKPDFVRVSAAYNAGSCRADPTSKWDLHATAGHISSEVAALNYVVLRGLAQATGAAARAVDLQFDLVDLVRKEV